MRPHTRIIIGSLVVLAPAGAYLLLVPTAVPVPIPTPAPAAAPATVPANFPFAFVERKGPVIRAAMPAKGSWLDEQGERIPAGKVFTFTAGSPPLKFSERHTQVTVTPQFTPPVGLLIETRFDARSFGRDITTTSSFIATP